MFLSTEFSPSELYLINLYRQKKISMLQLSSDITSNSKLDLIQNYKEDIKNVN